MTANQERNKALSRRALAEIDAGNFDYLDGATAPGATFDFPGSPRQELAGFKGFCAMFKTAFPDFTHELKDVFAEGDAVIRVGVFHGTHRGGFAGIPATGKRVRMDFIGVDRFRDGKLVALQGMPDMLGLMQQLGAVPAMAG
jgi:predicted ester cyclase